MLDLSAILTPGRVACHVQGGSKKRLFETIARTISGDQVSLPYNLVLSSLIAREKLGCTGLGQGIAIPHCRVENCTHALGTLVTLEQAIDYDAPDSKPVDILFVLLVPQEAQQQHLDILAGLAGLFNDPAFCEQVRGTRDSASLYAAVTNWSQ